MSSGFSQIQVKTIMQMTRQSAKLLAVVLLCSATAPAAAQTFSGRVTSAFYGFERSDTGDSGATYAHGYQAFQLTFRSKNITLQSFGQFDGDFKTQSLQGTSLRLYNLFLQVRNIAGRADIKVGRQQLFGGIGAGTIDGAHLRLRIAPWLAIRGFAGGLLPANQHLELIDEVDKNYLAGGELSLHPGANFDFNLSYYNKNQTRPGYSTLRADSIGTVFTQFIQPRTQAFEYAAIDAGWNWDRRTSLYSRADYDMHANVLNRFEFAVRSEVVDRLTLNAAYTMRSPRLPWNSIFSVFDFERNHEVEGGVAYRPSSIANFYLNAAGIFYEGANSFRFTLGGNFQGGDLNYVHRRGYAGKLDGVNAAIYYPIARGKYMPNLQFSWASYKLDRSMRSRQLLYSGAAGLQVRPHALFSVDGQIQALHNTFYADDLRLLLRVQYWFFTRAGKTVKAE